MTVVRFLWWLFKVSIVRFWLQMYILLTIFSQISSSRTISPFYDPLWVFMNTTVLGLMPFGDFLAFSDIMVPIDGELPSLFLILMLLMLTHI